MCALKLRIKIADHEFEAEGSEDVVLAQFGVFRTLLPGAKDVVEVPAAKHPDFDEVFRQKGRIISLVGPAKSVEDAILLLLLGQKNYRKNERVTGGELMSGLRASGHTQTRIDYLMQRMMANANIDATGKRRSRRYCLTGRGLDRAMALAQQGVVAPPKPALTE